MRTVLTLIISLVCFGIPYSALADAPSEAKKPFLPNRIDIPLPNAEIASDKELSVKFSFTLPPKHHLNPEAPSRVMITAPGSDLALKTPITSLEQSVTIPARSAGSGVLEYSVMLYYCEDGNNSLCLIRGIAITQPYTASLKGEASLKVAATLPS